MQENKRGLTSWKTMRYIGVGAPAGLAATTPAVAEFAMMRPMESSRRPNQADEFLLLQPLAEGGMALRGESSIFGSANRIVRMNSRFMPDPSAWREKWTPAPGRDDAMGVRSRRRRQ